jgi:hypothetical protein
MMRSVARRVEDFQFAAAERQRFAACQNAQIFLRHGKKLSVETLHRAGVKTQRAIDQLRGIDHV